MRLEREQEMQAAKRDPERHACTAGRMAQSWLTSGQLPVPFERAGQHTMTRLWRRNDAPPLNELLLPSLLLAAPPPVTLPEVSQRPKTKDAIRSPFELTVTGCTMVLHRQQQLFLWSISRTHHIME